MFRRPIYFVAFLSLASLLSVAQQPSATTWHFAVSGDSRNCGDVVMPAIAKSVHAHEVEFYWHLGDFRLGGNGVDEDMQHSGNKITPAEYRKIAWNDFITHQVEPFDPVAVHLGIGNHELYFHGNTQADKELSHADFIRKFSKWIGGSKTAYYHWKLHNVDFISLDNSFDAGFDEGQMAWLEQVLKEDREDKDLRAVVVGMHRALPNSLACGHSMNGDSYSSAEDNRKSLESGRRAYEDLWEFQNSTQKHVYVLASHSHFYVHDIFNTPYWKNKHPAAMNGAKQENVLKGELVGTAGARRYRLPDNLPPDTLAITYAYGYVLATVDEDGAIDFKFEQLVDRDVPAAVREEYKGNKNVLDYCFLNNRDDGSHAPVPSCSDR
jgi:hypothetical protein